MRPRRKGGNFSELAWQASKFLEKPEFPHVVGTGFFSAPDFSQPQDERAPKGVSYYFPKKTTEFWHEDYAEMFGSEPRPAVGVLTGE